MEGLTEALTKLVPVIVIVVIVMVVISFFFGRKSREVEEQEEGLPKEEDFLEAEIASIRRAQKGGK